MRALIITLAGTTLLFGCNDVSTSDSDEVKTSGIEAYYNVTNNGSVFTVRAELTIGDGDEPTYLTTTGGDRLTATFGGETKTLSPESYWHEATFSAVNGDLVIDFDRTEFISATGSTIRLSSASNFSTPVAGSTVVYDSNTDIAVNYSTSATEDYSRLSWELNCEEGDHDETRFGAVTSGLDDGNVALSMYDIFVAGPPISAFSNNGCELEITIEKDVAGSVSFEFDSGEFSATVDSSVNISVAAP